VRVVHATNSQYTGDPKVFAYASKLAKGTAMLRARHLSSEVFQLAVGTGRKLTKSQASSPIFKTERTTERKQQRLAARQPSSAAQEARGSAVHVTARAIAQG
jgi:hypothetical protein